MNSTTTERARLASIRADYRVMGNDELLAERQALRYDLAEAAFRDPVEAEVSRHLNQPRLHLLNEELDRRASLYAAGTDVPDPFAPNHQAWCDLADEIRERGDIVAHLQLAGCWLEPSGTNEWHGPCPACGEGRDRFVVWPSGDGRPGRYWCRRCQVGGDIIDVYRDYELPGATFHQAVRTLALELGLRTPDFGAKPAPSVHLGELRPPVDLGEIRHAS